MITDLSDPRVELARQTVGAVSVVADPTLPPRLLRLADAHGRMYFAKQHKNRERYVRETLAYLTWGRHLEGHAPELIGRHDSTRTLLVTAMSGSNVETFSPASSEEEQAHHDAGVVLGRLHRATAVARTGAIGADLAQRLLGWMGRADRIGLLSVAERGSLREAADALSGTLTDSAVCHLDYQPRNWIFGERFGVCDFEHMRRDARVRDFTRLEFRRWQAAPHLRDTFFIGYGTPLTDTDQRLLERFGAIEAITALVRGHEQDDPVLSAHGRTVLSRLS
ncbi:phosphotransferase [Streptomyces sp. NPDC059037]|uniref:phosphotransferase n=1 Tax=Streptomyces sp. NPDC059037 TaxID=3346710 RepID=UPI00368BBFCE